MSRRHQTETIHPVAEPKRPELVLFTPKAECEARQNIAGFIETCRNKLTIFGADLNWDENTWDITQYITIRGRRGRLALVFSNFETAGTKKGAVPMMQPFLDFAKSYMRYQQGMRETKDFRKRLAALRAVEHVLCDTEADGIPRPERIDPHILNSAIQLVQERMPASAYHVGNQIEILGRFMSQQQLTKVPFTWKSPIKKPDDHNIKIGKAAAERRKKRLPTKVGLFSLAHAFHVATEPIDIVVSSIAALLVCSPDRINEVFRLPVNCEFEGLLEGEHKYGLRWWPSKGAHPFIKPIVTEMVPVAKFAIKRLREETEEARRMARWYQDNPGKLYLPPGLENLRYKTHLSTSELEEIVGLRKHGPRWAKEHGCGVQKHEKNALYLFSDVEKAIIKMLPPNFPVLDAATGMTCEEALVILPKNFFHLKRETHRSMFEVVTIDTINNQLGAGAEHGKSSIFTRLGFLEEDGEDIKITTHQFRHFLNNLAQKKGIDQLVIALWSGRKDISQNAYYDHVTPEEILEDIASGLPAVFTPNLPVSRKAFLEMKYETAVHTTPYGYCVHDWSSLPCEKIRDCLDCTEHKSMKGDEEKTARIRRCLQEAEVELARDEDALASGEIGADKWLVFNRMRVERLRNLVQVLDDAGIPAGTIIELMNENEYSPVRLAVDERRLLMDPEGALLNNVLNLTSKPTLLVN